MSIVFLDTETTGLDPRKEEIFEIAVIDRGVEHVFRIKPSDETIRRMHPKAAEVNRYHERTSAPDWRWDNGDDVYEALVDLLDGKHICGAVPDFDARFITAWCQGWDVPVPRWHYHLIDIEAMAVGYLYGRAEQGDLDAGLSIPDLPWKSDALSWAIGVVPPNEGERHTALGDARWVKRMHEAMTGPST